MKGIPLALTVLGSATLGAVLAIGVMLIAEPWDDSTEPDAQNGVDAAQCQAAVSYFNAWWTVFTDDGTSGRDNRESVGEKLGEADDWMTSACLP